MAIFKQGTLGDDTIVVGDPAGGAVLGLAGNDILRVDHNPLNALAQWYMNGGLGNDTFETRDGNDIIDGGDGNDGGNSGGGNDLWIGGAGNDSMAAGAGDDTLVGGVGADRMTGGTGNNTFVFSAGDNGIARADWDILVGLAQGINTFQLSVGDTFAISTVNPNNPLSNDKVTITYAADGSQGVFASDRHVGITAAQFTFV